MEEVLHKVQPNVTGGSIDGREDEQRDGHEPAGEDHGPLPAGAGEVVAEDAEEDAGDSRGVDGEVGAVGVFDGEVEGAVFEGEDYGEVGSC